MLRLELTKDISIDLEFKKNAKKNKDSLKRLYKAYKTAQAIIYELSDYQSYRTAPAKVNSRFDGAVKSNRKLPNPDAYRKEHNFIERNIGDFNKEGMHIYGANVTLMRAVPDTMDGLKPVERRVLYGIAYIAKAIQKEKKVLGIIGSVINIHPHGDSSVGDTIVNLSKPWELLYPLIDIEGNNGQPNGKPAAAPRYLDAKLSEYGIDCFFKEWDINIAEMSQSYNQDYMEPDYISPRYPNMLVKPVTGFTFSTASYIPSYNMEESFNAVIELIKDPSYEPLLYPDMPSGCTILDEGQFPEICRTGKGAFKMKADVEIDEKNHAIHFYSIPYHTTVQKNMDMIVAAREKNEIPGITGVYDLSNEHGIDLMITCTADINMRDIVNILYKKTNLQDSFSVQMTFVDNYELKLFNLKGIMQKWIDNRRIMKHKFITFKLVSLRERNHILEALIDITSSDEKSAQMIHDVRHSTTETMIAKLCKRFKQLTSLQAKELCDMKVKQFNTSNHDKFVDELNENKKKVYEYDNLLRNPIKIDKIIINELKDAIAKYAQPRRCKILKVNPDEVNNISNTEYVLVFTRKGMIKKISAKAKGIGKLNDGDDPIQTIKIRNDDKIVLFDRGGLIHTIKVADILQTELKSPGTQIGRYATIQGGIVMCMPLSDINEAGEFVFVTEKGNIKKTSCSKYGFKTSIRAIVLKEGDGLASVIYGKGNNDIIVFTKNGFGNRFNTDSFSETSRMSSGVIAIDIENDDQVIGVAKVTKKDTDMALLTDKGNGKICTLDAFDMGKRRDNALKLITLKNKEVLLDLIPCHSKDKFMVIQKKEAVYLEYKDFPVLTRAHHGKKLVAVPNGETIIRFFKA